MGTKNELQIFKSHTQPIAREIVMYDRHNIYICECDYKLRAIKVDKLIGKKKPRKK